MGFRDYYRQFEDIDEEVLNRERRARRARERKLALERVEELDLSGTEWPDLPHSEIVNAAIARARGGVNGYPDRHATGARRLLADRHAIPPEKIVLGNGAAELLQAAAMALLSQGDELLMPWPSYPLYPLMAAHAYARPHPCERATLLEEVSERTRVVVVCNPNDPTGDYSPAEELGRLLSALPEHVHVLLDEALVHFQDVEEMDACLRLVEAFPRLLVVRTFSKAYGLSGLRAGYAVLERCLAAGGGGAGPGRKRPYAGSRGARAAHRRRRDRPPPPRGVARAGPATRGAEGAASGRLPLAGQLHLAGRARDEREPARRQPPPAGSDSGARRPARGR